MQLHPFPNRKTTHRLGLVNSRPDRPNRGCALVSCGDAPVALLPATALSAADALTVQCCRDGRRLRRSRRFPCRRGAGTVALPLRTAERKRRKSLLLAPGGEEGAPPDAAKAAASAAAASKNAARRMGWWRHQRSSNAFDHRSLDRYHRKPQRPRCYVQPQALRFLYRRLIADSASDRRISHYCRRATRGPCSCRFGSRPCRRNANSARFATLTARISRRISTPPSCPTGQYRVTVRISVDGYPRAFVYRVPIGIEILPDARSRSTYARFDFVLPLSGAARRPIDIIPVDFGRDLLLGAFDNPDDVEPDRRESLRDCAAIRRCGSTRSASRHQEDGWAARRECWTLSEARVSDFHQFLCWPRFAQCPQELLGRIFAVAAASWLSTVEIVLDGSLPQIEPCRSRLPVVVIGPKDEEVSVWATIMSAGAALEHRLADPLGTGKFGGTAPAVLLTASQAGY